MNPSKIQLLPTQLINQIAAGEVIERPSSIVKELIENSVDANATNIEVIIQDGGKKLIQVIDNGEGMDSEDLKMSFQRHATSKIKHQDELRNITSLGFRGEALPSIASVSNIHAKSSINNNDGNEIVIKGGEVQSLRLAPGNMGTSIQVKNLFYNTPARRKFMKSSDVEKRNIYQVIRTFSLAYPEIGFTLIDNEKLVYKFHSNDLIGRLKDIYGKKFSENLLAIDLTKDQFKVSGFIGNLNLIKKRLGEQFLFLNGRSIQNRLINSAIFSSYKSLLSRGEYPFFIINLQMPADTVDVNVHPAKSEVRFKDEWRVFYVVKSAAIQALTDLLKTIPDYTQFNYTKPGRVEGADHGQLNLSTNLPKDLPAGLETAPHQREPEKGLANTASVITETTIKKAHERIEALTSTSDSDEKIPLDNLWQLKNKYIITEVNHGLIIIDQHVAHERILFESAKKALEGNGIPSQTVLFPQTIKFLPEEYSNFLNIIPYLHKIGFRMREFGVNTIIVEGIPSDIYSGSVEEIVHEILDKYTDKQEMDASFLDYLAATYACKAAIKAGDRLKHEEMKTLVDKLFATDHPYYCPHGRPIIVRLGLEELDKRFERT